MNSFITAIIKLTKERYSPAGLKPAKQTAAELESVLRATWDLLTVAQMQQLMAHSAVTSLVAKEDADAFFGALQSAFSRKLDAMRVQVEAAGYVMVDTGVEGCYWHTSDMECADSYPFMADAVVSAYHHLQNDLRNRKQN